MNNIKKIVSFLIVFTLVFPNIIVVAREVNESSIKVTNLEIKSELNTEEKIVVYTGIEKENIYVNKPVEGKNYLLVTLQVNTYNEVDSNSFKIMDGNNVYSALDNDEFLNQHGYTTFNGTNMNGTIVFEIPKEITLEKIRTWNLEYLHTGEVVEIGKEFNIEVPRVDNIVDKQQRVESHILTEYSLGKYTLHNPYIVRNPYSIAPLTALVIFETQDESKVSVNVKGKDKTTDIEYKFDEYSRYHEVPIVGMYAGRENEIELTVTNKNGKQYSRVISIKTDDLPTYMLSKNITLHQSQVEKMESGLTMLIDSNRTIVDCNGEIRWFTTISGMWADVNEFLENGHFLLSTDAYTKWAVIYELDLLGKIYNTFTNGEILDHDAAELTDGNILTFNGRGTPGGSDTIIEINRDDWKVVNTIDFEDIFNNTGSQEIRSYGNMDWFHGNTIEYNDGSIIISARNQHTVFKMKYPEKEIEWIFSVNREGQEHLEEYYLTPIGEDFEWFYSQHNPSILPDLDNNPDTLDLLVFDNVVDKALVKDEDKPSDAESYSRIVHYRIHENNRTVEQIWEYGKELGSAFYSHAGGGAQYLVNTGNYIGTFAIPGQIVEVTPDKEIVYHIKSNEMVYRAYRKSSTDLIRGFSKLGECNGQYNVSNEIEPTRKTLNCKDELEVKINTISRDDQFLAIEGNLISVEQEYTNLYLQLISKQEAYTYTIGNNISKNFKQKYLDISGLKDGIYDIYLIGESNGKYYRASTSYEVTIGYPKTLIEEKNLLTEQESINAKIQNLNISNRYSIKNPLIIQDPYGKSPLTAMIMFNTNQLANVSVEIKGKSEDTTIRHTFNEMSKVHRIPIYGLYANYNNQIDILVNYRDGSEEKKTIYIKTDELPKDIYQVQTNVADKEAMAEGLTFVSSNYISAIDSNGEIRWYLSSKLYGTTTPIKRLRNGHLIIMSDRSIRSPYYQTGFYEMDLLGRVYNEYIVEGIHHSIQELENGNFIVSAEKDSKTTEDYIVEIDRDTGNIIRSWDLGEILGIDKIADATYQYRNHLDKKMSMNNASEEAISEATIETSQHDWFHNNSTYYDEKENAIIVSGRQQDIVMKFDADTKEIKWILSDINDEWPEELRNKLLNPKGETFEWQYGQHAIEMLPNGDIMLYDNGNFRTKIVGEELKPEENYSRAVIYRIDEKEMSVEQVWQYGKERGNELYTPYIGDVDYISDGHYLINFGGIIVDQEGTRYDSPADLLFGDNKKGEAIIIEIKDDKVINEIKLGGTFNANTYRVERMPIYYENEGDVDLNYRASRRGELGETDYKKVEVLDEELFEHEIVDIQDEGDRIIIQAKVKDLSKDDRIYVVLSNGKDRYGYLCNERVVINKTGITKGIYDLCIMIEPKDGVPRFTTTQYQVQIK